MNMDKHSAGYVIQGAKNSFGVAVLWGGVWVQETEVNPREEVLTLLRAPIYVPQAHGSW